MYLAVQKVVEGKQEVFDLASIFLFLFLPESRQNVFLEHFLRKLSLNQLCFGLWAGIKGSLFLLPESVAPHYDGGVLGVLFLDFSLLLMDPLFLLFENSPHFLEVVLQLQFSPLERISGLSPLLH